LRRMFLLTRCTRCDTLLDVGIESRPRSAYHMAVTAAELRDVVVVKAAGSSNGPKDRGGDGDDYDEE
jgi:hypothetical protein